VDSLELAGLLTFQSCTLTPTAENFCTINVVSLPGLCLLCCMTLCC